MAASDCFRFPACNFIKKDTWVKMFICEFCKIFKNISWQSTSGWRTWIREELNLWWSCEMPTCKLMKKTLSHIVLYAFCLHFLRINTITFSEMLWRCASTISFRKYNRKVIIYLFNYDSSKSIFFFDVEYGIPSLECSFCQIKITRTSRSVFW